MTHPVNNFWVKDVAMSAPGSTFFSTFADGNAGDWTELVTDGSSRMSSGQALRH
jgi:hypothetical protein